MLRINRFCAFSILTIIIHYGLLPATKMGYICNDPQISHKFKGEVVTTIMLLFGSSVLPLLVLFCAEILTNDSFKKLNANKVWFYYKEGATGCTLTFLITELAKMLVREHRPHFLDVCEPDTEKYCVPGTFVNDYICTNTKYSGYFIADNLRSFPSAHSSVAVFVGIFSVYVLQYQVPAIKTRRLLKPFLISVCVSWGLLCSLTRITDRRHHWWDVLVGVIIGTLGALYTINLIHKKVRISTSINS